MVEGTTTVKNDVLVKLAVQAASEVTGVAQVGASTVGKSLAKAFGGSSKIGTAGVEVTPGEPGSGETSFDMTVSVTPGASIPDVADRIREATKNRLADVTGLNVTRVDVHVDDIKEEVTSKGFTIPFMAKGNEQEEEQKSKQESKVVQLPR